MAYSDQTVPWVFLASFCLTVAVVTAATYMTARRLSNKRRRAVIVAGSGLFPSTLLVMGAFVVVWTDSGSEPLEIAVHVFALALVAAVIGQLTSAILAALKA